VGVTFSGWSEVWIRESFTKRESHEKILYAVVDPELVT
jgi:hypothetical protein